MAYKILLPQDIAEEGKQYLRDRGYEIKMGSGTTLDALKRDVRDCEAIVARTPQFTAEVLKAGEKLRVVARHGVGVDNIDVEAATSLGIYVTNAPESNANSVAEHTMGLILSMAKDFRRFDAELRRGNWGIRDEVKGVDLEEKVLGIIGMGRIGRLVAKKASRGFDMKVLGYDPYVSSIGDLPGAELEQSWETVFRKADFISLHLPATPETRGIVGGREFELMKPTAYLINAARGEIVREGEMIEALKNSEIAGAAMDVFEQEPPSKSNPLLKLDNVLLTPHNAALTRECSVRMAVHAAMGTDDVLSGRQPKWPVNNPVSRS